MHVMQDFISLISKWMAWVAGAIILFGCAFPITIDVISRAVLGRTLINSFELTSYAFAISIGLGMGFTVSSRANIRIDILAAKLPRRLRLICDMVAAFSMAITAAAFAWYSFDVLSQSWTLDARSQSTLAVPLLWPQSVWWFGFVWFAVVACLTPCFAILRLLSRDFSGAEALISMPNLDEEMNDARVQIEPEHS